VFVEAAPLHRHLAFDAGVLGSIDAVVQVREVRRALEGEIAALAAERATRAQLTAMRAALRDIDRQVAAGGDGVDEDLRFHRALAEATGNPQFGRLMEFLEQYLRDAMRVTRGIEARRTDFMAAVREEHRAIVEAVASRDVRAARQRALEHMTQGERRLQASGLLLAPALRRKGS
jgi:GntR family transcriptional repressor for pyruvate dehydrogenase complex